MVPLTEDSLPCTITLLYLNSADSNCVGLWRIGDIVILENSHHSLLLGLVAPTILGKVRVLIARYTDAN